MVEVVVVVFVCLFACLHFFWGFVFCFLLAHCKGKRSTSLRLCMTRMNLSISVANNCVCCAVCAVQRLLRHQPGVGGPGRGAAGG